MRDTERDTPWHLFPSDQIPPSIGLATCRIQFSVIFSLFFQPNKLQPQASSQRDGNRCGSQSSLSILMTKPSKTSTAFANLFTQPCSNCETNKLPSIRLRFPILKYLYIKPSVSKKSPITMEDVKCLPNLFKARICERNTPMALFGKTKILHIDKLEFGQTRFPVFYNLTNMEVSIDHDRVCDKKCTWITAALVVELEPFERTFHSTLSAATYVPYKESQVHMISQNTIALLSPN
ncbi:F-box family protein [Trifolium medium]|uniref:F-box family protein n=1 Tax=Trifolium medium TaxID=97028 RepID=A0A392M825_9FABA|nr:F-box family protein [Trifolium medium]